jgi:hypothetical protein
MLCIHTDIYSGNTVALQTYAQGRKWLSCNRQWCHNSACPTQSNNFWNSCTSSVFQIYRKGGTGCIRTGDHVGFHYPALSGHWLACVGPAAGAGSCYKSECPDFPSVAAGFSLADLWKSDYCDREVFEIAACGRSRGYCIRGQDRIFLKHVHRGHSLWLALGGPGDMNAGRLPCPRSYTMYNLCRYNLCVWESFQIWKKPWRSSIIYIDKNLLLSLELHSIVSRAYRLLVVRLDNIIIYKSHIFSACLCTSSPWLCPGMVMHEEEMAARWGLISCKLSEFCILFWALCINICWNWEI